MLEIQKQINHYYNKKSLIINIFQVKFKVYVYYFHL